MCSDSEGANHATFFCHLYDKQRHFTAFSPNANGFQQ